MDKREYLEKWSQLHRGVDPTGSVWVRGYLSTVYQVVRVAKRTRLSPNAVTVVGGLVANGVIVWAAVSKNLWALCIVMLFSLFVDALDGAVAVATDRATSFGAVLDSVFDRINELTLVAALVVITDGQAVLAGVTGLGLTLILEYARTKAASLPIGAPERVTVWERPTRTLVSMGVVVIGASVTAGFLTFSSVSAASAMTATAWAWPCFAIVGLLQMMKHLKPYLLAN